MQSKTTMGQENLSCNGTFKECPLCDELSYTFLQCSYMQWGLLLHAVAKFGVQNFAQWACHENSVIKPLHSGKGSTWDQTAFEYGKRGIFEQLADGFPLTTWRECLATTNQKRLPIGCLTFPPCSAYHLKVLSPFEIQPALQNNKSFSAED